MKEANFQTIFGNWVKENKPQVSVVWELKMEKGKSIAFDRVDDNQIERLTEAKSCGFYHKISDSPFGHSTGFRFHKKRPLDCLWIASPKAYVVVLFYELRKPKETFWIDVDVWVDEAKTSSRKSLTKDRAREIASKVVTM